MGLTGSVTAAVSATSVTLPSNNLNIVAISVYDHTVSGYISLPIDLSRNALLPFTAPVGVTTTNVPATNNMPHGGLWHVNFTAKGNTVNFTGVGLTSGTFVFYYGTNFSDSVAVMSLAAVVNSFTTGTSITFSGTTGFPGDVQLTGIALVFGVSTTQTNLQIRDSFNTATGKSLLVTFSQNADFEVQPLDNLDASQTLTVTQAYSGTHVGTGYLFIYYK